MSCLGERTKENISACSLVMTCMVKQGQLVSMFDASGSITGAHDPEPCLEEWLWQAAPQAAQPHSQTWTEANPAPDPGLSRLRPSPSPSACRPWARDSRVQPHLVPGLCPAKQQASPFLKSSGCLCLLHLCLV